jgi:hypothetical protein
MTPIIIGAAPVEPSPERFSIQRINNVWRVLENVSGKSYIICDAANQVAAHFIAQACNERHQRAMRRAVEQLNQFKSHNFKRGFLLLLTAATRSAN